MTRMVERRVIPALDVLEIDTALTLVRTVAHVPLIYGFKIGFPLSLRYGLPRVVEEIRRYSEKPIIYDHQKAATDIPDTGKLFAEALQMSGVSEAILFPQAGPATLRAWFEALAEHGLKVIVGGIMTHEGYLISEGGYLDDARMLAVYRRAANMGVRAFVVPLTRLQTVNAIAKTLEEFTSCEFYSPGFGAQGGSSKGLEFLSRLYIIIGRSLLRAENPSGFLAELEQKWSESK
jgi:orotidine-5'-phosphate decarboxylase